MESPALDKLQANGPREPSNKMNSRSTSSATISVIVPTIGRPDSLTNLLKSLCSQTLNVTEVVVADGSSTNETAKVIAIHSGDMLV